MANIDSIPVRRMPVLTIPDIGAEEHNNELRFRIVTVSGMVNVAGRHAAWHCTGCAEALALAGLVDMAWLPGLKGNNKVSQTVVFTESGPNVYRGNPKGRRLTDNVRIQRLATDRFEVRVPANDEQAAILKDVSAKYFERLKKERRQEEQDAAREAYKAKTRNSTPEEVMETLGFNFEWFCAFVHSRTKESGFQFDAASERSIEGHMAALRIALRSAVLSRMPSEFTGNVVPFARGA